MSLSWLPGHEVELLRSGQAFFPALIEAIGAARCEVLLETYIFENDAVGAAVCEALVQTARRGVRVCLLLDGFGAAAFPRQWREELSQAGARALFFRPHKYRWALYSWHSWTWGRYKLRRLHRKISTIDGQIAFVGGINIIDDWDSGARAPRFDFCLKLRGPIVERIRATQASLWRRVCWSQLRGGALPRLPAAAVAPGVDVAAGARVAFVARDNIRHRHSIERMYLQAIREAQQRIVIANAYFLPGWRFRRALTAAAARGVEVHLLLQGWADYRWVQAATRTLYPEFLDAGIHVHEYQPAHVHAKVMVVDGEWATVGSSNIDPLSLLLAREANVAVHDRELAGLLEAELWQAIQHDSVTVDSREPRSRWLRFASMVSFFAARLALRLFPTRSKYRYWDNN